MRKMSRKVEGLVAINVAAVIFGTAALYGSLDVSVVWIVCVRALFAACTLGVLGFVLNDVRKPLPGQWLSVGKSGFILALHWLTFFASVQTGGVAIATVTFSAFPFFSLVWESLQERKRPGVVSGLACVAIVCAVLFMTGAPGLEDKTWGVVCGVLSAVLFTAFGASSKRLSLVMSPLNISLWQNAVVALVLLPLLPSSAPVPSSWSHVGWLLCLGVLTTACMHQLYFYALRRLPASVCGGFIALEPVYAMVFSGWFFGEVCPWQVWVSGAVILMASFALLYDQRV